MERQRERRKRGRGREKERETEFNLFSLSCQAADFYGDWFPLPWE